MSNPMTILLKHTILLSFVFLAACGGQSTIKPTPKATPTTASSTSTSQKNTPDQSTNKTSSIAIPNNGVAPPSTEVPATTKPGAGGYYLDDGPSENAPANIDGIPGATPKYEQPNKRANRPYSAAGKKFAPMTQYTPYKKQGIASWYGKRFHGKKTSTGEIYDMYAMSAAHTTLPIPSYAKVTNPANGRAVIVRVNDRGPFIGNRILDLSYAAAYQLRLIKQGSGLVEIELINTSPEALRKTPNQSSIQLSSSTTSTTPNTTPPAEVQIKPLEPIPAAQTVIERPIATSEPTLTNQAETKTAIVTPPSKVDMPNQEPISIVQYYVQAGAFKNEMNSDQLIKRIQDLDLAEYVGIAKVYNNNLYRVKLGPYESKQEAEGDATNIRVKLNIPTFVTNQ